MTVIDKLCVGCGLCGAVCPQGQIEIQFSNDIGSFIPSCGLASCVTACGICEKVCPFSVVNSSIDELTRQLWGSTPGIAHDSVLGYCLSSFVGYSNQHRLTSSSGGLLTWLLETLLEQKLIDAAVCVGSDFNAPTRFKYKICRSLKEIRDCAGSCYQPVESSEVIREILKSDQRYAVVALPCLARGLRMAMQSNKKLRERIVAILGLTCGQMKNRHFVEYMAWKAAQRGLPRSMFFRRKSNSRPANDFSFEFHWSESFSAHLRFSQGISRPWCERWFTLEACDYCDDVFAECADAVFMDAWLPGFISNPKGHSLVAVRNAELQEIFNQLITNEQGSIESISLDRILQSQESVIHQKRKVTEANVLEGVQGKYMPDIRHSLSRPSWDVRYEAKIKRRIRKLTTNMAACSEKKNKKKLYFAMKLRVASVSIAWRGLSFIQRVIRKIKKNDPIIERM